MNNIFLRFRLVGIILLLSTFLVAASSCSQKKKGKYEFTQDWFSGNVKIWKHCLSEFAGRQNINYLEIGTFEGRSCIWMLENILTHPTARLTGIDVFFNKDEEDRFDRNMKNSGSGKKVKKIKDFSQIALRKLKPNSYDIIYIDGSHMAKDVFIDAVLSWDLLKVGGMLIFDDYQWHVDDYPPSRRPKIAIDAFMSVFGDYSVYVYKDYQVIIRKLAVERPWEQAKPSLSLK